jgi:hypothetical protein
MKNVFTWSAMKKYSWILLSLIASIGIAIVCYFWATNLMASLYAYRSPFASQPLDGRLPANQPVARQVVAIVVDGLRVDTAADETIMPFLSELRQQGASAVVHSGLPSYSAPSWSVLVTGAWPDISDGPAMNPTDLESYYLWTQDNIYASANRAGLSSALAGHDYFKFLVPANYLTDAAFTQEETDPADQKNAAAAVRFIQSGKYQYVYVHLLQVDYAGHYEGGPIDPHWNAAATRVDGLIKQVVGSLDLSKDTVIIYSDHGQIKAGGHGGQDPEVMVQPFIMAGAGIKPGVYGDIKQVDVAPTTTVLLGAAIPALSQGHALVDMLNLDQATLASLRKASIDQQSGLYKAYTTAIGVPAHDITISDWQDPVDVFQSALQIAKNGRLNRERLPRFIILGLLALLPLFFYYRQRGRVLVGLFLAGLLYLLLFHVQYALLNGGTYTLSTVLGSTDLILTTARYSILGYIPVWVLMLVLVFRTGKTRLEALNLQVGMTYTLLYVLSLPALWSLAYNGALVGWTLPDVASMFFAFIFILQLLFVSIGSIPLLGITALVVRKS